MEISFSNKTENNIIMERLTPQEENAMLYVWELKECAIKDVWDKMEEPKPPYTTLASIFNNLDKKGYVTFRRFGNVKVYKPQITKAAYKSYFMSGMVKSYFNDSFKEMITFFAKKQELTTDDLNEIIELIEKGGK